MKRFLSSLLVFLLIITMIPVIGVAEGSLFITSPKTINGKSGEILNIPITIKNTGVYVENVSVTAEILDPTYVYLTDSAYDSIPYIESDESRKVSFEAKIDDLAPKGTYKVNITIKYDSYSPPINDTIYIRIDSEAPKIAVSRLDIMPNKTVNPEDNFKMGIELENLGDTLAKDIKVYLEGLSEDGFTISNGSNNQTIYSIPGGFKNYALFELKASKRINPGTYQLKLKLKYNGNVEQTLDLSVNVASNKDKTSNLLIENLVYPTDSVGQNQEVTVSFDLRNQGQSEAKNIIIVADSKDPSGLVPKSISQVRISSILPEATEKVEFKFLTTRNGETKNYPIDIRVEYVDDIIPVGEKYELGQFVGVFVVSSSEDGSKSTPKLIIDKYDFEPSLVKAGENYTMNLSFFNTNSEKTVRNIKIFLTSDERTDPSSNSGGGSVFTPVGSSNTFYIDSIPPKGRVEKKITMFTVPDAQAKTYTLTANFEYEDNKGEQYTATELIGVPVIQQSKLEIGELSVFPEAFAYQSTPVSVQFYNTGKVTLYNMMVKLEGDFQTENGNYYIGNFTSGSQEYFEGYVIPSEPGELKGYLVFTYEDSTGKEQEIREEFTLNVMEQPPMPDFPGGEMPPFEEPKPSLLKSKWFWGGLILTIAIIGFVIFKRRKKKKEKGLALDE